MRQRWLLIILGPALVFLLGSVLALSSADSSTVGAADPMLAIGVLH